MRDTIVKTRWVEYSRYPARSTAPRDSAVRVYGGGYKAVTLQLRNEKHYMTATLDAEQVKAVIAALSDGLAEIEAQAA